jgi:hypothetical protein
MEAKVGTSSAVRPATASVIITWRYNASVAVNDVRPAAPTGSSWLLSLSCLRARPAPAVVCRGGETPDPRAGAELIACDAAIIHDAILPLVWGRRAVAAGSTRARGFAAHVAPRPARFAPAHARAALPQLRAAASMARRIRGLPRGHLLRRLISDRRIGNRRARRWRAQG